MKLCRLLILVAVLLVVALGPVVAEASLRDAERTLDAASLPPTDPDWTGFPRTHLTQAMNEFQGIITRDGPNADVYMDMSVAAALQGNYQAAVGSLEQAQALSPRRDAIRPALDNARLLMRISETAGRQLPQGQIVLRMMGFPARSPQENWAVLSAVEQKTSAPHPTYSNVLLTLFRGNAQDLRRVWQSEPLGTHGYTNGEFNDLQLYLVDLNADTVPEAVVPESSVGADWMPSHVDVFAWRAGRFTGVLSANSEFPVQFRDLNFDRTYEVLTTRAVGWDIPRVAQPAWTDIYAYRNGVYQLSDEQFPGQYRDEVTSLRTALQAYPNDFELHEYLGMAYRITGHHEDASSQFQTALEQGRTQLDKEADPQRRTMIELSLSQIQQQTDILNR